MKVNCYLNDELGQEAKERGLEMSSILQDGVKRALREIKLKEGAMTDVELVAARLRASKEAKTKRDFDEGYELGMRWAKESASYTALEWFAGQEKQKSVVLGEELMEFLGRHFGTDPYGDPNIYWEALEEARRNHEPPHMIQKFDDPFYGGLRMGALDVWRQVAPLLDQ